MLGWMHRHDKESRDEKCDWTQNHISQHREEKTKRAEIHEVLVVISTLNARDGVISPPPRDKPNQRPQQPPRAHD